MGVKSFVQEVKTKVSASRLFKALFSESHEIIPKVTTSIKSIEIVEGHGVAPGCILQTNFPEGAPIKYIKNRIDAIDHDNCSIKFTLVEGAVLGDKFDKICYDMKIDDTEDGSVIKVTSEYHTKGDIEISDEEIKAGKESAAHLYNSVEEYLIAHPHVCA